MNHLKENIVHGNQQLPLHVYHTTLYEGIHDLPLHYHNEMEIIYIVKGVGSFQIDLQTYTAKEGDMFIIKKGMLHGGIGDKVIGCECLTIVFDLTFLESNVLDSCHLNFIQPIQQDLFDFTIHLQKTSPHYNSIASKTKEIHHSYKEKQIGFELEIKAYLYLLFSTLFQSGYIVKATEANTKRTKQSKRLKDVLDYIHKHFYETISIHTLASVACYSDYYFMRFFKEQTGQTCTEYITSYRLKQAEFFLTQTSLSITEIALETGFESMPYFSNKFKDKYGLSPLQYRKKQCTQKAAP